MEITKRNPRGAGAKKKEFVRPKTSFQPTAENFAFIKALQAKANCGYSKAVNDLLSIARQQIDNIKSLEI